MQRSSESIACLTAALAKAQTELTNPEKSLVATIRPNGFGEPERSFRYAPPSSGLTPLPRPSSRAPSVRRRGSMVDEGRY
jgi:hypothetical protein